MRPLPFLFFFSFFLSITANGQSIEKIPFDSRDTTDGYYLAIAPQSKNIKGTLVLCNSFTTPERMLTETKLHNVAYANDLLVIAVSMKQKFYADDATVARLNTVFTHVADRYKADTSSFVLAGYDFAGNIALRFTELTAEQPGKFTVSPKAVMAIDSPVDLFGFWSWCERQVKRKSRSAGDANYILELMTKELGTIHTNKEKYQRLTPFYRQGDEPGNEQFLKNIPVRLYYDVDVEWLLKDRQNSLYDTNIPDGSELISRLLQSGNKQAELVAADKPGMNSRGIRTTNSLSIVDEVECIHWIKNKLEIFDAHTWEAPYYLATPAGWEVERFPIPIDFAPQIQYSGVEDVRFAPGWGDEKSEEYWSYAYLWWLDGNQKMDASVLQQHLKNYYAGLVGRNITGRNIPSNKVVPTTVVVKKVKMEQDDLETYKGTVSMLDYMTQKPMVLNLSVHIIECFIESKTVVFIEVSPQPFSHAVWKKMDKIKTGFACSSD